MEEKPGADLEDGRAAPRAELSAAVQVRVKPAGAASVFADLVPGHGKLRRMSSPLTLEQIAEGRRVQDVEGPDDGRAGVNGWHLWLEANAEALLAAAERVAREADAVPCPK